MKVGIVGVGAMGREMAGHIRKAGHDIVAFDTCDEARQATAAAGLTVVDTLARACRDRQVVLVMVATDAQTVSVVRDLLDAGMTEGAVIAVAATVHPLTMKDLEQPCAEAKVELADAPVCYGLQGAIAGDLISLCGGSTRAIKAIAPVLSSYSRSVEHLGPLGSGQIGKTCNNMMHWAACVANYETLALAKACGIDAQEMRETLLKCPARNTTLERWDTTRFTWHEKDMDVALDLAQRMNVPLPLFGAVDQLVKRLSPGAVKSLLYGDGATYLGQPIEAGKLPYT